MDDGFLRNGQVEALPLKFPSHIIRYLLRLQSHVIRTEVCTNGWKVWLISQVRLECSSPPPPHVRKCEQSMSLNEGDGRLQVGAADLIKTAFLLRGLNSTSV